jgi:hypothetical protein
MPKVITDIDRGYKALLRRMRGMKRGPNVSIGVQGTEASDTRKFGETNIAIAVIHEFGSVDGTIPQRSYLRSTADRERALFERALALAAKRVAVSGNVHRELGRIGELGVAKVKQTINQSIGLKPLKPATERRKGSTRPLIDTGILKNSITWKVRMT